MCPNSRRKAILQPYRIGPLKQTGTSVVVRRFISVSRRARDCVKTQSPKRPLPMEDLMILSRERHCHVPKRGVDANVLSDGANWTRTNQASLR